MTTEIYLGQIRAIPLLTAADERLLGRSIEDWLHVEQILEDYREENGKVPSWGYVFVELLREFQAERPVYSRSAEASICLGNLCPSVLSIRDSGMR